MPGRVVGRLAGNVTRDAGMEPRTAGRVRSLAGKSTGGRAPCQQPGLVRREASGRATSSCSCKKLLIGALLWTRVGCKGLEERARGFGLAGPSRPRPAVRISDRRKEYKAFFTALLPQRHVLLALLHFFLPLSRNCGRHGRRGTCRFGHQLAWRSLGDTAPPSVSGNLLSIASDDDILMFAFLVVAQTRHSESLV